MWDYDTYKIQSVKKQLGIEDVKKEVKKEVKKVPEIETQGTNWLAPKNEPKGLDFLNEK